jgi:Arc/MetJ-type ribon-helix-helix transcriptional regulator
MSKMITVRMPEERVARIDELVRAESYESRASFIVEAIDRLVDELEQREIDRRIVEGYTRLPQTGEELRWAEASARRSVEAEPW